MKKWLATPQKCIRYVKEKHYKACVFNMAFDEAIIYIATENNKAITIVFMDGFDAAVDITNQTFDESIYDNPNGLLGELIELEGDVLMSKKEVYELIDDMI